ncbi:hypothetical protein [Arthrobacter sp. CDRTa11]|nr:hypothetical protein [Arthrobacter sp. CDRTa11]
MEAIGEQLAEHRGTVAALSLASRDAHRAAPSRITTQNPVTP